METVIILENMPYSRYRLKDLLENNGLNVIETSSSLDFFNRIFEKQKEIDLIILDLNLYGEDGLEVINKIKEKKILIPIIVVTSENKRKSFVKCVQGGIVDYILKPYENNMLVNRVIGCIENGGKWAGEISRSELDKIKKDFHDKKELKKFKSKDKEEYENEDFRKHLYLKISSLKDKDTKISILLIAFIKWKDYKERVEVKEEYSLLNEQVYEKLKSSFYKPNKLFRIGFSVFAAVLPSSNREKINKTEKYLDRLYNKLKSNNIKLKKYGLKYSYVVYPDQGMKSEELIKKAEKLLKENIENVNSLS
ncbi:response regulator [Clostridium rectalis]|uniref:response regulator n=1 Tax=Clostridium rectalis TaxID=2040295 RepID=UPI0013DDEE6A|nr:response regulator [Clostridium rectalis]